MKDNFDSWIKRMEKLIQQEGIVYVGMVDHEALARGYSDAGFILYPTTFQETGCITVMKAMVQGAIPITSRFLHSTLPELTEPWDLGPTVPIPHTVRPGTLPPLEWIYTWADAVVSAAEKNTQEKYCGSTHNKEEEEEGYSGSIEERRALMKASARTRFAWSSIASLWSNHFQ